MKRILSTLALGALLAASVSMSASAHPGGGFHGGHGGHGPVVHPGHGHDWGHGPGRWHGPERGWHHGWDRHVYRGGWFWLGAGVLWWDGVNYIDVVPVYDPVTGTYYFVRGGVRVWLR